MVLRIVQVGLGRCGRSWAKDIFPQNKAVELVAYVDAVPEVLSIAQKELGVAPERSFTSLKQAFASFEADAVLITTSLAGHVPVALEALNAGKHVLLEKPFAPTLAEAQSVVKMAEQRGCILMIDQNYRYYPSIRAVQKLIREDALGRVGSVKLHFRRNANAVSLNGNDFYRLWQPLLVEQSIHYFDLMRMLLNQEPVCITCKTWNPPWSNFVDPTEGTAIITFDGGTVVTYYGSWVSTAPQTNWAGEWHIECEHGEIVATGGSEKSNYVTVCHLGKHPLSVKLPEMALQDRHGTLEAFVKAVQTYEEPECSGRHNLKTLALMLAAVESSTSGNQINII